MVALQIERICANNKFAYNIIYINPFRYQVAANRIGKIIQGLIREQIYMQIFLNCHLAAF